MVRNAIVSLASLSLVAIAALPASASAQSIEFRSTEVSYSDLNLGKDKDVATLLKRIQRAADQVCNAAVFGTVADLDARQRYQACVANAEGHAVASVHSTRLNAIYAERTGSDVAEIQTASSH
jgi:UrcA family protein